MTLQKTETKGKEEAKPKYKQLASISYTVRLRLLVKDEDYQNMTVATIKKMKKLAIENMINVRNKAHTSAREGVTFSVNGVPYKVEASVFDAS